MRSSEPVNRDQGGSLSAVLVVDDNPGALETLMDVLTQGGYRVDAVDSGAEAIDAVRRAPYHLVLMDVQMPEMTGIEALRIMRERAPELRVALMTAYTKQLQLDDAEALNPVAILAKPLHLDRVFRLLAAA